MELAIQLFVLGLLVEAIVDTLKLIIEDGRVSKVKILSLVVGIGIALTVGIDIFEVIGIVSRVEIIGIVLSGILISRGGNFIHDLMDRIRGGNDYV